MCRRHGAEAKLFAFLLNYSKKKVKSKMEQSEDIEFVGGENPSQFQCRLSEAVIEIEDRQKITGFSQSGSHLTENIPLILRNYFQIVSEIVSSKATVKCLFCPGNKTFSGNLKSNGNLVRHLVS